MKIGFIGAGKVGTSLGIHFAKNGIPISGYFSKSYKSSSFAADCTKSAVFLLEEDVLANSDMIFITTPDDEIRNVCKRLFPCEKKEKILVHCSGALSSEIFAGCEGISVSAHPMEAFSTRDTVLEDTKITVEGQEKGVRELKKLFRLCGNHVLTIRSEDKAKYHSAAVMASNFVIALGNLSLEIFKECGFSREDALKLMAPLMKNNINNFCEKGPEEALTGPIERGDIDTISKHLSLLNGPEKELYRLLSRELIKVAQRKNENKDYTMLSEKLEEV